MKKFFSFMLIAIMIISIIAIPVHADTAAPLSFEFEMDGQLLKLHVVNTVDMPLKSLVFSTYPTCTNNTSVFSVNQSVIESDYFIVTAANKITLNTNSSSNVQLPAGSTLVTFVYNVSSSDPVVEGNDYQFSVALDGATYKGDDPFLPNHYEWENATITGSFSLQDIDSLVPIQLVAERENNIIHVKLVATAAFRFTTVIFNDLTADTSVFSYDNNPIVGNADLTYDQGTGGANSALTANPQPYYFDAGDTLVTFNFSIANLEPNALYTFSLTIVKIGYSDSTFNEHIFTACNGRLDATYSENILQPEYDATPITVEQRDQIADDSRGALRFKITVNLNGAKLVDGAATYNDNGAWTIGNRYAIIYSEQSGNTTTIPCPLIYSADANQLVYTIVITNIDAAKADWNFLTNAKVEFTHGDVTESIETNVTVPYSFNSASGQN